jgi:hypothetical protein
MLSNHCTKLENALLARVLELPGLTTKILCLALYRLRKSQGLCVITGCPNKRIDGQARCVKHQQKNREYAKRFMTKPEEVEE